ARLPRRRPFGDAIGQEETDDVHALRGPDLLPDDHAIGIALLHPERHIDLVVIGDADPIDPARRSPLDHRDGVAQAVVRATGVDVHVYPDASALRRSSRHTSSAARSSASSVPSFSIT